jgi:dTDP-4-amino-4,6-dideoxygalactose transaminase
VIPQAAPHLRIARFRSEIDSAIASVVGNSSYILGPAVTVFEDAFAAYTGAGYCVGVNSGTDALALCLRALGIGAGDEVITTALTASATALAILQCGAKPHFVDVSPVSRCIDPAAIAAAVNARTAAIMPVHLFGHPADMPAIMKLAERQALAVIEDCAHAHGATLAGRHVGTFGTAGAFSFYPTKNLGALGDAGAIITGDAALNDRLRRMRNYGFEGSRYVSAGLGFNSRLDTLQAAVLLALLPYLDDNNRERRTIAAGYEKRLSTVNIDLPAAAPGAVYHQFAIACAQRDALADGLRAAGIQTAIHYAPALHQHPAFAESPRGLLAVTEALAKRLLSLPIQPEVAADHVDPIASAILHIIKSC